MSSLQDSQHLRFHYFICVKVVFPILFFFFIVFLHGHILMNSFYINFCLHSLFDKLVCCRSCRHALVCTKILPNVELSYKFLMEFIIPICSWLWNSTSFTVFSQIQVKGIPEHVTSFTPFILVFLFFL